MADDNNTYFDNDLGCKVKCENNFSNCYSCNKTHCNKCKSGYFLNYKNKCIEKVEHCQNDTSKSNYSQCDKCEGKYLCLNKDKTNATDFKSRFILLYWWSTCW